MKSFKLAAVGTALAFVAAGATAAPISDTNSGRPVGGLTIGSTSDSAAACQPTYANCELQSIFNVISPGTNVQTDQKNFGLFSIPGGPFEAILPLLRIEVTANSSTQAFGIWYDGDGDSATTGDRVLAELFSGSATATSLATVLFNFGANSILVNGTTTYNNFGNSGFGFYLQPNGPNPTWYSVDSLNAAGATQFLAYQRADINRWFFAFEDQARNASCQQGGGFGGDCDHNDMIVSIESIQGGRIPEPATTGLIGLALAALGLAGRRRKQ